MILNSGLSLTRVKDQILIVNSAKMTLTSTRGSGAVTKNLTKGRSFFLAKKLGVHPVRLGKWKMTFDFYS